MGNPHRIGVIGLGVISGAYLETLRDSGSIRITAVADLDRSRADAVAATLPGTAAMSVAELLGSDTVDTVLNLTIPAAHAEIALAAIAQGKNVYGEKPIATSISDAQSIMRAAAHAGVRIGSAPDTVLGTGTQTARSAVAAGLIGRPLAATATMVTPGHERWHPHPDFYYQPGGGPMLDMGPYYISALIHVLGPVRSVIGSASRLRPQRTITNGPRSGEQIVVEVETHVTGVLEHESGALTTITTSFDGNATTASPIEIHGELGSLTAPDPNQFAGEVRLARNGDKEWETVPISAGYVDGARGAGLLDFVAATAERPSRAGGDIALHAFDVMDTLLESARTGLRLPVRTTVERPSLVPLTDRADWLG
ncbi:oxidoreductase [Microbacterium sp. Root166]|uniref:Gfo/Idh/MocA family protein n=1 Tax=Microbacterium sp. Root166 TaxID=1736478 RepID=UPI0006FEE10B|nr:Gfo/Idh/MocA family oxidoreductase [Microbacterium sp. Root166]KQZ83097.1 oxidoreductase [Microbacterium sp. Root166]